MKRQHVAWLFLALALTACSKHKEAGSEANTAQKGPALAPATPPDSAASAIDPEIAKRQVALDFALMEQRIKDDPKGQWAVSAEASSTYSDAKDQQGYSAWQATGAPNVTHYGDRSESWASKEADAGLEWLEVGFGKPVHASGLRIRQNNAPGAIVKVELIDDKKNRHTVSEGVDTTRYTPDTISWYEKQLPSTEYLVTGMRITLATNAVPGWNEIDAVQLIGE